MDIHPPDDSIDRTQVSTAIFKYQTPPVETLPTPRQSTWGRQSRGRMSTNRISCDSYVVVIYLTAHNMRHMWIPSPHESIQSFPESSLRKYSSLDYLIPYHQNLLYSDSQSDVPITPIMTANTTSDPLTSQFSRLIDAVSYERWTYHLQETGIPFSPEHDLI